MSLSLASPRQAGMPNDMGLIQDSPDIFPAQRREQSAARFAWFRAVAPSALQ